MSTFVALHLDDRTVRLGRYPHKKVRDFIERGHQSALWRELRFTIDNFYPNSTLLSVEVSGDVSHVAIESYKPDFAPAIKAYGLHV